MIDIRIDDGGLSERLDPGRVAAILRPPMTRSLARMHRDLADYPPQRSGARYRRGYGPINRAGEILAYTSEQLGRKWTTRITELGTGLRGEVGNNVSYGPYVQDEELQAHWNDGIWQTDKDVADQNETMIRDDFADALARYLRG